MKSAINTIKPHSEFSTQLYNHHFMRIIFLLLIALSFSACEDEIDEGCPEINYRHRLERDTIFYGTWKWSYSVCDCSSTVYPDSIYRDTLRPNVYSSWIGGTYPDMTVQLSEGTIMLNLGDTVEGCVVEWFAWEATEGRTSLDIYFTSAYWPEARINISFYHYPITTEPSICSIRTRIVDDDICGILGFNTSSGTKDFYIKEE